MSTPLSKDSPSVIVELVESEDDLDLNNNHVEQSPSLQSSFGRRLSLRPTSSPADVRLTRRKSSASRYGFDEAFVDLVAKQCQLVLETENILGRGSFGTVVAANYQGKEVAAKIIDTKGKREWESVKNEENVLDLGHHPNVVNTIDIFRLGVNTAIIILPRLRKGNLLTVLNKGPVFPVLQVVTFAIQIAAAVTFCHVHDLLHLDIKPQNVLIDFQNNLCLCDFGNSRRVNDVHRASPFTVDGTVGYKAPELFCGHVPTTKADIYSVGITLWQILERELPYPGYNEHTIIYKVVSEGLRPTVSPCQDLSTDKLQSLIKSCWQSDPAKRPDMEVILAQLESINHDLQ